MRIDLKKLRALLKTLADSDVTEFEFEDEKTRVRLARGTRNGGGAAQWVMTPPPSPPLLDSAAAPAPAATRGESEARDDVSVVTSPFVGTFYRAPSPDAPSFCEVGSVVREGQTLCIIEAMKLMNEIEADCAGTIVDILVENGKSVEFGQPLFHIAKS
ncbi:MAG TPA: acetyl-CoA carboxylase biotin carboxyl carrier protein [Polyangiaceae bacterium]|jgi:acetyl-CoA carboxylase biotin carboxyl carrier protein|nr:acetyl-CoA carboxylase biotin carboxyl carrier protein [Polyangiaceae bacterium]